MDTNRLIKIGIATMVAIIVLRVLAPFRFLLLIVLILSAVIALVYFSLRHQLNRRQQKAFEQSTEGQIQNRLDYCQEQIRKNQAELLEVEKSIEELTTQSRPESGVAPFNREEGQKLIRSFELEKELRTAKLAFYEAAKNKLSKMLANHQFAQTVNDKKEQLRKLKENHYEDLAEMEALRLDMEMQANYLETIEELSLKMFESNSVESALVLQRELEEMTREI
ncbi:MAG TPA: hypothetical protein PKA00_06845 [Saprospiraceae bacterium]|nr:hypothetical protein [Saprospiraceae bacterium]HMQ82605.1 hypothetical protein [Saprospiraceae bacterium]